MSFILIIGLVAAGIGLSAILALIIYCIKEKVGGSDDNGMW